MSRIVSLRKYILSKVLKDGGKEALRVLERRVFGTTNKNVGDQENVWCVLQTMAMKLNAAREECVRVSRESLGERDQDGK